MMKIALSLVLVEFFAQKHVPVFLDSLALLLLLVDVSFDVDRVFAFAVVAAVAVSWCGQSAHAELDCTHALARRAKCFSAQRVFRKA